MITNYASLKLSVASWLNRSDLTASIPEFVQLAEAQFRRDSRVRKLVDNGLEAISADGMTLPADFKSPESWAYEGPQYFGPIEVVGMDRLAELRGQTSAGGPPRYVAFAAGKAYFAPVPPTDAAARLTYWARVVPLSDTATTNWLLEDHPDAYLFGALLQAAPFLAEDERIATWGTLLEGVLDGIAAGADNERFGGTMVRRPRRVIGG